MKHIRTINSSERVLMNGALKWAEVTCEEYATVWAFTCKIVGHELPCALDWRYKKNTYENAKQEFLQDVVRRYNQKF